MKPAFKEVATGCYDTQQKGMGKIVFYSYSPHESPALLEKHRKNLSVEIY